MERGGGAMEIQNCLKADFDQILIDIQDFWGSERTLPLHHPMFLHEFGNSAYVMREGGQVIAYLFGFLSQTGPMAYVHLVGVRQSHQRKGLASRLYEHFIAFARRHGCTEIKAITSPANSQSILFHRRMGMEWAGDLPLEGIPVIRDYRGPGKHAVVFRKRI